MDHQEFLPIVDKEGNVIGKELRAVCHNGISMLLHPVVHLHVINPDGAIYIQKRAYHKDIQPGKWDTSVGGHVDPGETIPEALKRETLEEIGMEPEAATLLSTYIWESSRERELVHSYIMRTDKIPVPDPHEVDEGRFWTIEEIKGSLGKGIFTPNFEKEFAMILEAQI